MRCGQPQPRGLQRVAPVLLQSPAARRGSHRPARWAPCRRRGPRTGWAQIGVPQRSTTTCPGPARARASVPETCGLAHALKASAWPHTFESQGVSYAAPAQQTGRGSWQRDTPFCERQWSPRTYGGHQNMTPLGARSRAYCAWQPLTPRHPNRHSCSSQDEGVCRVAGPRRAWPGARQQDLGDGAMQHLACLTLPYPNLTLLWRGRASRTSATVLRSMLRAMVGSTTQPLMPAATDASRPTR
jgi:hypothetical protein